MSAVIPSEPDIAHTMLADRHRLQRELRAVRQAERDGKPFDRNLAGLLERLERSTKRRQERLDRRPTAITYDDELPVSARREEIAAAIREHPVVIVCGETGSGKSTQLPKICLESGRGIDGMIGHSQPRRIAARTVAARIAQELGTSLGTAVGFKVRFTDETGPHTLVKLLTDGMLLAETQHDRFLEQYDTLILDEAHERSLNIDFLMGYVKRLLPKRPELRLIITSATIDAQRFAAHFATNRGPAPVIEVSGRTYPVDLRYRPPEPDEEDDEPDMPRAIAAALDEIAAEEPGDVLIFLPTEHAIHETTKHLRSRGLGEAGGRRRETASEGGERGGAHHTPQRTTEILPLYARLSTQEQQRVFEPHVHRRIVLATNVAESSLTVPGIRAVIDTGTARISRYSARSKVQRLPIEAVSQASADQRAGRCGRVGPGICIRLYSQEDYAGRDRYTVPEIQRTNLAAVILQAKALALGEIEEFPFLDPPKPEAIRDGYRTLFELGAIDEKNALTPIGRALSRLPVDPRIGRMILAAREEGCLHEVLIIAAALEIQDPRDRPHDKQQAADDAHSRFADESSDFLGYLKLWDFYHELKAKLSRNQLKKACLQNFLSPTRMWEWIDVHRQLVELAGRDAPAPPFQKEGQEGVAIHRALLTGLFSNVALKGDETEYIAAGGGTFVLWPGSGTFAKKPKWIMAAELVETTRRYLRTVARIDPAWIEPLAKHLISRTHSDPHWSREASSAMAFEKVSLMGLPVVPRRRVRYGPIDPVKSRELFIQHALVEGDFDTPGGFLEQNRQLVESLAELQTKTRRFDFLPEDQVRLEFYEQRIPSDVFDGQRFEKWRREAERANPQILCMTRDDLLKESVEPVSEADFPDAIAVQRMELPLEYRYEPGGAADGITLTIPREALNQLDPQRIGWLVPGLLEEKIAALIKSLPKDLRRHFVPVPDTAKRVLREVRFGDGDFAESVAGVLRKMSGEAIPPDAFQVDRLPEHLRMNVRVVDESGTALAAARDLHTLRTQLGAEASASFSAAETGKWNRDGLTTWELDTLPESIDVTRGGVPLKGYPAIVDQGESVSVRLVDCPHKAGFLSRAGTRRLFTLQANRDLRTQVDWLPNVNQIVMIATTMSSFDLAPPLPKGGHGGSALAPPLQKGGQGGSAPCSVASPINAVPPHPCPSPPQSRGRGVNEAPPLRKGGQGGSRSTPPTPDRALRTPPDFRQQLADVIADRAFFDTPDLPRTAHQFQERVKRGRNRISVAVQEVAQVIGPVITAYNEARHALDDAISAAKKAAAPSRGAKPGSRSEPATQYALDDIRLQIALLIEPGFLTSTRWEWLHQYPRYFKAIVHRLGKLGGDSARDRKQFALLQPLWRKCLERREQHRERDLHDPQLVHYRWMLEEWRVQLFAQSLGTGIPVSEKRIDDQWAKVRP